MAPLRGTIFGNLVDQGHSHSVALPDGGSHPQQTVWQELVQSSTLAGQVHERK